MQDWISHKVSGHQRFSIVPVALLLHPDITNADLRVFACLAAHAKDNGHVYVSRARIAKMCGYLQKGEPNVSFISRFLGPKGSLVKAGFVRNLGQRGFDECCEYQLVVDDFDAMSNSPLRNVESLNSSTYRADKRAAIKSKNEQAVFSLTGSDDDMIEHENELIFRAHVLDDLAKFKTGAEYEYSYEVYAKFKIQRPLREEVLK